jgi:hypothetical protein
VHPLRTGAPVARRARLRFKEELNVSLKKKLLAAAASLTLVGGAGVIGLATAATANASTPSCGSTCIDVFSHQFGTFSAPQFVMDSFKQGDVAGTPVILFRTSNADPAEDFTVDNQGLVSEFFAAGLVSSAVALHYGCTDAVFTACSDTTGGVGVNDYAYEFMYSPFGVQTGLCVGTGATAVNGTKVTLQPCGVSGKTIWISDSSTGELTAYGEPLINGSDTDFSEPYSLTYPGSSYPTDEPRPGLYTSNLSGFSDGAIDSNQLWSADEGVLGG